MELLSPAGNLEKLYTAIKYGADAVYFGGEAFGLRAFAGNLTFVEMKEAMKFLHSNGKRGYLTVNSYAKEDEIDKLREYLKKAEEIGVDAFIISDLGVFHTAREVTPNMELHISTQANTTNSAAIKMWHSMGASRVIMARELNRDDLSTIIKNAPCDVEIFGHGAICISYSGRCIISAYMTGRDANRGECTQPCRWNYSIHAEDNDISRDSEPDRFYVKEASRPNLEFPIEEGDDGTYLYNAKDLRLINRIGELVDMGVSSLKIEGRMKSVMYVAITTAVYRNAIDIANKLHSGGKVAGFEVEPRWVELLDSVSNRNYTEGFYAGVYDADSMNYATSAYVRNTDFLGVVESVSGGVKINCRGKFTVGESLEVVVPSLQYANIILSKIIDNSGSEVEFTKPNEQYILEGEIKGDIVSGAIIRRVL